ncbi:MAG: hypothetical protein JW869_00785 [Candidatus Omnitrophica bacterium]|nr:hypothetical protein [Candidatus Omnitrophota bacterium]
MQISNKKGSILAFVVIFIIVFSLMGYGLLYLSSVDAVEVVDTHILGEAFWVAEAGIERAINNIPSTDPLTGTVGDGAYSVTIAPVTGHSFRWTITSTGTVNSISRTIQVVIGPIGNVITSNGPIDTEHGNPTIEGTVEEYANFTFPGVFGMSKAAVRAMAANDYIDPPNNQMPVEDITWIEMSSGNRFNITSTGWSGNGLLVIEGDCRITGGTFTGILWVTGSLEVAAGNPLILGSIFVECDVTISTDITGTPDIGYDSIAIDEVYIDLGTTNPARRILSWQEL